VFENRGALPFALIDSEMYAFREWLPNSGYDHANAPEMEVYPIDHSTLGGTLVEFWLPIRKKICNN
jgi:AraC family transcriptional regulator